MDKLIVKNRKPQSVIIIEDDVSIQAIVKDHLAQVGIKRIDGYDTGEGGWRAAQALEYDFIILDWKLPIVSGSILLSRFRSDPIYKRVPILVMSGFLNRKDFSLVDEMILTAKMEKPFRGKLLIRCLEELMDIQIWYEEQQAIIERIINRLSENHQQLIQIIEELVKKSPLPQYTAAVASECLCSFAKFDLSETLMTRSLAQFRNSVFLSNATAQLYFLQKKYDKASELLIRTQKRSPENLNRLCRLGEIGLRQGQTQNAQTYFQEVLQIDNNHETAKAGLEVCANMVVYLKSREKKSASFAGLLNNIGIFFVKGQEYDRGIRHYENSFFFVYDRKAKAKLAYNLGLGFLRCRKPELALNWFRKSVEFYDKFKKSLPYIERLENFIQQDSSQSFCPAPVKYPVEVDECKASIPIFVSHQENSWIRPGKDIIQLLKVSSTENDFCDDSPREKLVEACAEVQQILRLQSKAGLSVDSQIKEMQKLFDFHGSKLFRDGILIALQEKCLDAKELAIIIHRLGKSL